MSYRLSLLLVVMVTWSGRKTKSQGVPITYDTKLSREKSGQEIAKYQESRNKWQL